MTFFNKFIDKAKHSSAAHHNSTPSTIQQPSTPAQTPTKELPSSGLHNTFTSLLQHHKSSQSSMNGLATPPATAHPELSQSTSSDEATRMSLDNPGKITKLLKRWSVISKQKGRDNNLIQQSIQQQYRKVRHSNDNQS